VLEAGGDFVEELRGGDDYGQGTGSGDRHVEAVSGKDEVCTVACALNGGASH
jgi:hypothetical protein